MILLEKIDQSNPGFTPDPQDSNFTGIFAGEDDKMHIITSDGNVNSLLTDSLTSGHLMIGNGQNKVDQVPVNGDITYNSVDEKFELKMDSVKTKIQDAVQEMSSTFGPNNLNFVHLGFKQKSANNGADLNQFINEFRSNIRLNNPNLVISLNSGNYVTNGIFINNEPNGRLTIRGTKKSNITITAISLGAGFYNEATDTPSFTVTLSGSQMNTITTGQYLCLSGIGQNHHAEVFNTKIYGFLNGTYKIQNVTSITESTITVHCVIPRVFLHPQYSTERSLAPMSLFTNSDISLSMPSNAINGAQADVIQTVIKHNTTPGDTTCFNINNNGSFVLDLHDIAIESAGSSETSTSLNSGSGIFIENATLILTGHVAINSFSTGLFLGRSSKVLSNSASLFIREGIVGIQAGDGSFIGEINATIQKQGYTALNIYRNTSIILRKTHISFCGNGALVSGNSTLVCSRGIDQNTSLNGGNVSTITAINGFGFFAESNSSIVADHTQVTGCKSVGAWLRGNSYLHSRYSFYAFNEESGITNHGSFVEISGRNNGRFTYVYGNGPTHNVSNSFTNGGLFSDNGVNNIDRVKFNSNNGGNITLGSGSSALANNEVESSNSGVLYKDGLSFTPRWSGINITGNSYARIENLTSENCKAVVFVSSNSSFNSSGKITYVGRLTPIETQNILLYASYNSFITVNTVETQDGPAQVEFKSDSNSVIIYSTLDQFTLHPNTGTGIVSTPAQQGWFWTPQG